MKNMFLKISQNSQESIWTRVSFVIRLQALEILAVMFSGEFREIFKNTFFTEHLRWLLRFWLGV